MLSASQLIKKLFHITDNIINDTNESTNSTYSSSKINKLIKENSSKSGTGSAQTSFEIWEYN